MLDTRDRLNIAALWTMMMLTVVSSWYPFTLDLPKRVVNTAVQHPGGAWDLDGNSRVISPGLRTNAAEFMSGGRFSMTVQAMAAAPDQTGPARLISVGHNPYQPALMIGIDRKDVVLYLPCDGAASNVDAEWRISFDGGQDLMVRLWIDTAEIGTVVSIQINNQPRLRLDNSCPAGTSPRLPEATAPWALGNVASGHRPFVGRIDKLELSQDRRRIDLLRAEPWQAPSTFWIFPERLYEPSNNTSEELVPALWHLASFAMLGYLAAASGRRRKTVQLFAATFVFAMILIAGKVFVAGRHPDMLDLFLNAAGAAVGTYGYLRYASINA
jgi:VanZ family protein